MKKKFVLDIHTHSIASGHSYGTIREMAEAAKNAGLQLLGISEHGPGIPGTVNPFYYTNLEVIPRSIYGVEMVHGCEINVLNGGKLSLDDRFVQWLDYALVGIHDLCYENEGIEKNTQNVIECMKHKKVFFVSHPDDSRMPLNYEKLVHAAKVYHVALEVNNSSFRKLHSRKNVLENYRTMLALCKENNVPIIVNTDAHDPSAVGNFELAYAFLETVDFPEDLILNYSTTIFKDFIGL